MKLELEIQTKPENDVLKRTCNKPEEIYNLDEVQAIKNAIQEHFLFIGLDTRNNIRSIRLIGIGTCNNVKIDSKEIVRTALLTASESVILVHNHPSNNLKPSKEDLHITNFTSKILNIFNITMLDHIIVTEKEYYSMGKNEQIDHKFENAKLDFVESLFLKEENEKLKDEIKGLNKKMQKSKYKDNR